MSTSVVLPALGESVTEGTVTRWLKKVGDTVEADEGLLEISTDKVDTEIPSPVSGVIEEILVQEDETVEVGAVLAKIGDGSGAAAAPRPRTTPAAPRPLRAEAPAAEAPAAEARRRGARRRGACRRGARRPRLPRQPAAASGGKDVVLPELGESVTEGTVTRWLKQVGDAVAVDEPLLEISTDKVDTEIPSPFAGVLAGDPRPGGRDRRRRLRPRAHRRGGRCTGRPPPATEPPLEAEAPAAASPAPRRAPAPAELRHRAPAAAPPAAPQHPLAAPAAAAPAPAPRLPPRPRLLPPPSRTTGHRRLRHAAGAPSRAAAGRRPRDASPAPASAVASARKTC